MFTSTRILRRERSGSLLGHGPREFVLRVDAELLLGRRDLEGFREGILGQDIVGLTGTPATIEILEALGYEDEMLGGAPLRIQDVLVDVTSWWYWRSTMRLRFLS